MLSSVYCDQSIFYVSHKSRTRTQYSNTFLDGNQDSHHMPKVIWNQRWKKIHATNYSGIIFNRARCWKNWSTSPFCKITSNSSTSNNLIDHHWKHIKIIANNSLKWVMSAVGFECANPNVSLQRTRFIPLYFRRNRSMFNFVKLLQSVHDIKIGRRAPRFAVNSQIV